MDVQAEHGSGCTTVGMELTESLKHGVAPDRGLDVAVPDHLHVVPFGLVRDREQRRRRLQDVRLIIIAPVRHEVEPGLGE